MTFREVTDSMKVDFGWTNSPVDMGIRLTGVGVHLRGTPVKRELDLEEVRLRGSSVESLSTGSSNKRNSG